MEWISEILVWLIQPPTHSYPGSHRVDRLKPLPAEVVVDLAGLTWDLDAERGLLIGNCGNNEKHTYGASNKRGFHQFGSPSEGDDELPPRRRQSARRSAPR